MTVELGPFNGITWNWDDYHVSTNPYGLNNGGFRTETGLELILASIEADVGVALQMTSTTSLAITVASKTFTVPTLRPVPVGQYMMCINDASNFMFGQVTATDSDLSTVTVNVTKIAGSGTKAAWTLQPTAPPPTDGVDGDPGVGAYADGGDKTSDFTAVVNTRYTVDCTVDVTVTLPAAPSKGDGVQIAKYAAGALTVDLNGLKYYGSLFDPVTTAQGIVLLQYTNAAVGWIDL